MMRMTNTTHLLLFLLLTLALAAAAPSATDSGNEPAMAELTGFVLSEEGKPLAGVEVSIKGGTGTIRTDSNGFFGFKLPPQSEPLSLTLFKDGFMPALIDRIRIDRPEKIDLKLIRLKDSPLEEIVITGTSTPKKYREVPVKTSVTPATIIERKGAETLADTLDLITGVRVEDNCQNCGFNQVRINGMEGKYAQVLINGRPMVSTLAGVYLLEQLPANMIEKLEVVKGGGSSLYGGNAVAGVINLITKEPMQSENQVAFQGSMIERELTSKVSFNYNYVSKDHLTRSSLFINHQDRNPVDLNDDGFSDLGKMKNFSGGATLVREFTAIAGRLTLDFATHNEDRRGGNHFDKPEHFADVCEAARTRRLDLSAAWEQTVRQALVLKGSLSYSYTKRNTYYGAEQDPNAYGQSENPVVFIDLKGDIIALKSHTVTIGASYQHERLEDTIAAYHHYIDDTYNNLGLYLQDEWELGESWSLLGGLRFDKHSNLDNGIWSPRASVIFKGIKNLSVRGTFSTGFRAPQVFDEDMHITIVNGDPSFVENDPDLRHESSHSFTLGLDYGIQLRETLLQLSFSAFDTRVKDAFMLDLLEESSETNTFRRINSSGMRVQGLEFEAGVDLARKLNLNTGWTLQRSRYDDPDPDFDSLYIFKAPDFYGHLGLNYSPFKNADMGIDLTYTGRMYVAHYAGYIDEDVLEHTPDFWDIDLSARYTFRFSDRNSLTVGLTLENALDQFQEDLDMGMYRDAGYMYGPRLPRTLRMNCSFNF